MECITPRGPSIRHSRSTNAHTLVNWPLPPERPSSEDSEMKTPFASDDERLHLLDLTSDELRHWLDERGYPAFRNGQIWAWVMQCRESFDGMSDLPRSSAEELDSSFRLWAASVAAH